MLYVPFCRPDLLLLDGECEMGCLGSEVGRVESTFISDSPALQSQMCVPLLPSEPTNMLDVRAILWLENYLQVSLRKGSGVGWRKVSFQDPWGPGS